MFKDRENMTAIFAFLQHLRILKILSNVSKILKETSYSSLYPGCRTIRLHSRRHPGVVEPLRGRQSRLLVARELGQHDGHGRHAGLECGSRGRGEHDRNSFQNRGQRGSQKAQGKHLGGRDRMRRTETDEGDVSSKDNSLLIILVCKFAATFTNHCIYFNLILFLSKYQIVIQTNIDTVEPA